MFKGSPKVKVSAFSFIQHSLPSTLINTPIIELKCSHFLDQGMYFFTFRLFSSKQSSANGKIRLLYELSTQFHLWYFNSSCILQSSRLTIFTF